MAEMIFYAKAGCHKMHQYQVALQRAGNVLRCRDILTQSWTREKLLPFIRGREPLQILDSSAVEMRNRSIDPVLLLFEDAVDLMVASPGLIKGPLIEVEGLFIQGFGDQRLGRYLGDSGIEKRNLAQQKIMRNSRARNTTWQKYPRWSPFYSNSFA